MSELARRLAALIEGQAPAFYCCACLAARLATDEREVREAAQILLISVSERYETVRGNCSRCGETDTTILLVTET